VSESNLISFEGEDILRMMEKLRNSCKAVKMDYRFLCNFLSEKCCEIGEEEVRRNESKNENICHKQMTLTSILDESSLITVSEY